MRYKRTVRAGITTEIKEYHSARLGAHFKRVKKFNITSEAVRKNNYRRREETLRWLMNENFQDGTDALVTFSFRKDSKQPQTYEEMLEIVQKLTRKIRREWKVDGLEAKYIYCMEIGSRGARHVHMILNEVTLMRLIRVWGHEVIDIKPLNTDGQYRDIASYFVKYSDKTSKTTGVKLGRCYNSSHNLKQPKITRERVFSKVPAEPPAPPRGFFIEKQSVRTGINLYNGLPFLEYCLHPIASRDGRNTHVRGNSKVKALLNKVFQVEKSANAEKHPCDKVSKPKKADKKPISKSKKRKSRINTHGEGIQDKIYAQATKGIKNMKKIVSGTLQKIKEKREKTRYTQLK